MHQKEINPENYPGDKVTHNGFLVSLLSEGNRGDTVIEQNAYKSGHKRTVNIKRSKRSTKAEWSTSVADTCQVDGTPAMDEFTQAITLEVGRTIFMSEETYREYCVEASRSVAIGKPATAMMDQFYRFMLEQLNGGYGNINDQLLTAMSTKFGYNHSGNVAGATPKTVNFAATGTSNNYTENYSVITTDMQINEICGTPFIVGNGNFHVFWNQFTANALGFNQSGYNNAAVAAKMGANFYYDQATVSKWGANRIGVFAPGSVQFLEFNRNVDSFAGDKQVVFDFQFFDPRVQCWDNGRMKPFAWDASLSYNKCDTEFTGYGGTATYGKGWLFSISKTFDLYVDSATGYDGADTNVGQNGTLWYTINNS